MGQASNKRPARGEQFGDPRLANVEIIPIGADQRVLSLRRVAPLWAALGLMPAAYGAATGLLALPTALAAVGVATAAIGAGAALVAVSSARYGLGFAPLCRAAFGGRGAWLPLLVRWLAGVAWLAGGALVLGRWIASLVAASALLPPVLRTSEATRGLVGLCAALLLGGAYWAGRRGMSRLLWVAPFAVVTVALGGFGLTVWAGIASRGFGDWFARPLATPAGAELELIAALLAGGILTLLSGPDWERFRVPFAQADRRRGVMALLTAPLAMAPVAVAFAFLGALLAAASTVVRNRWDAHLIPDAAGFGGLAAGAAAALVAVLAWWAAAGLVGFYSGALALCGLPMQRLSYPRGLALTWLASTVTAVAMLVVELGPLTRGASYALAAIAGVLLADAVALRRTRVVLEDLYLFTPGYGPIAGVTLSAGLAVAAGLLFEPTVLAALPAALRSAVATLPAALALPCASLAGAGVYLALAPLERGAARLILRLVARRGARPKPERLAESSVTDGLTDPHYQSGGPTDPDDALFQIGGGGGDPAGTKEQGGR